MKREKLNNLLTTVEVELSKAKVHYNENKIASQKMSETTRTSWSSAGDREYAMDQEEVTKMNLEMLRSLFKELKRGVKKEIPEKVSPPCFVRIHLDNEDIEFYLVDNVASIEGFRIISTKSPVGKKIKNKKKYEVYDIADITGRIVGIE